MLGVVIITDHCIQVMTDVKFEVFCCLFLFSYNRWLNAYMFGYRA